MAIIIRILLASVLAFALVRAKDEPYNSRVLEGSVTCVDCPQGYDLSGVQVLVKCDKVKKLAMTYTEADGSLRRSFRRTGESPTAAAPSSCMAKIMGGPQQLYAPAKDSITQIANAKEWAFHYRHATQLLQIMPSRGDMWRQGHRICFFQDCGFPSAKGVGPTTF